MSRNIIIAVLVVLLVVLLIWNFWPFGYGVRFAPEGFAHRYGLHIGDRYRCTQNGVPANPGTGWCVWHGPEDASNGPSHFPY